MASKLTPLSTATLAADHTTLLAIQNLNDYQPTNPAYDISELMQAVESLMQAEQAEIFARDALREARRLRIATGHAFHDLILAAKTQVIAQYGEDSPAVKLIGLTRKSDYRWPEVRRARTPKRKES